MKPSRTVLATLMAASFVSLGASCDGKKTESNPVAADPPAAAEAADRVEALDGVDVSEMIDAERGVWVELINEQLSPCGDPVNVGRCVAERRKCGACPMAARYLARLVMEGHDKQTIVDQYTGRFSNDGKKNIDVASAPTRGATMAAVTIVEYSDFQCPYCGRAHPHLQRVLREFDGRVKIVFKHFPISTHLRGMPAARAAEAAAAQGKFWEMHDLMFEHQTKLEDADLKRYAEELELDLEKFEADLASPEVQARIEAARAEGVKLQVSSTPSIFINGRLFQESAANLSVYISEELER